MIKPIKQRGTEVTSRKEAHRKKHVVPCFCDWCSTSDIGQYFQKTDSQPEYLLTLKKTCPTNYGWKAAMCLAIQGLRNGSNRLPTGTSGHWLYLNDEGTRANPRASVALGHRESILSSVHTVELQGSESGKPLFTAPPTAVVLKL